jgi:hypothetical protein
MAAGLHFNSSQLKPVTMKRNTVAAIVIAVLLVFSFFLYRAYRHEPTTVAANNSVSLLGEWELDSAYAAKDSNKTAAALNALPARGSIHFSFKADSTLGQFTGSDSLKMRYYQQDSSLYLDKGNGYIAHSLQRVSDSVFSFATADSLIFVLKRR